MTNTGIEQKPEEQKIAKFVSDKILPVKNSKIKEEDSLIFWLGDYFEKMVSGGKDKTKRAKKSDLQRFLSFFNLSVGDYHLDYWTPSLTKEFQKFLLDRKSNKTRQGYKATTINRIFATLKHASKWINERRAFKAGDPFEGVKDLTLDEPDWNGLTDRQLMLLRGAIDQRIRICVRKNQNPLLEAVVFYILLHTGLREFELCSLTNTQYHNKGFHEVKRKGNMISKRVFLPDEAKGRLDQYLEERKELVSKSDSLLLTRYNTPLAPQDVARICERISNQACVHLKQEDKFKLTPHQLRHTFLKRANDKHGISYAKKVSGNVGEKELYRYTAPSQAEVEEKAEGLFG